MPHQKGNNYNLRLAMRESALDRKCDHCGRKAALSKWHRYGGVSERDCRWCGAAQIITSKGRRTMPPEEVARNRAMMNAND